MPSQQGTSDDSADHLPDVLQRDPRTEPSFVVARAGRMMVDRFADRLGEVGLKPHTLVTLLHLSRGPALTSAELARRLEMTPQSMSALLRGMVEHGLVTRPGGSRRGQRVEVRLTDLGRAALERARPALHRMADPAEMGLTAGEAATLRGLLERVIAALTGESCARARGAGPGRLPSDD